MENSEFIEILRREGELFAAAVERGAPDAPVAACPGWSLRDLVTHLGSVHRWATAFVAEGREEPVRPEEAPPLTDAELAPWLRQGHARLVETLVAAPADTACWTFLPAPSPLAFWARRQAHETAVHRADAELAVDAGPVAPEALSPLAPGFAADGIDELLTGIYPGRDTSLRFDKPWTLSVRATDVPGGSWTVRLSDGPPRATRTGDDAPKHADCTYTGKAADLYLVLWNRLPDETVPVTGDLGLARSRRELTST